MHAKKNTITLDLEPEDTTREDVALLLFNSIAPNYAFVDDLNHLYNLKLSRTDDLELDNIQWPLFSYYDPLSQLNYYIIERPAAATNNSTLWTTGHKLLILIGQLAAQTVSFIHNEFSNAKSLNDPQDIIASDHLRLLDDLRSNFTTTTLIDPTLPLPPTLRGKALRNYTDLFALTDRILDTLDAKFSID